MGMGKFRPPLSRPIVKIWNFKNPRWRRPPSLKIEKSRYLGNSSTDFNQFWHGNVLRSSWAVRLCKVWNLKNPRCQQPSSWKSRNRHISFAVRPISTKFGVMTQFDPLERNICLNFQNLKVQDGSGRHLEKLKNCHISATVWPISTKFGTAMQCDPLYRSNR